MALWFGNRRAFSDMDKLTVIAVGAGLGVAAVMLGGSKAGDAGRALGGAAVDMVDGVVSGVVVGAGELVGIPATNETECERAIREGRTLDASFACPAGTFIKSLFS